MTYTDERVWIQLGNPGPTEPYYGDLDLALEHAARLSRAHGVSVTVLAGSPSQLREIATITVPSETI